MLSVFYEPSLCKLNKLNIFNHRENKSEQRGATSLLFALRQSRLKPERDLVCPQLSLTIQKIYDRLISFIFRHIFSYSHPFPCYSRISAASVPIALLDITDIYRPRHPCYRYVGLFRTRGVYCCDRRTGVFIHLEKKRLPPLLKMLSSPQISSLISSS